MLIYLGLKKGLKKTVDILWYWIIFRDSSKVYKIFSITFYYTETTVLIRHDYSVVVWRGDAIWQSHVI